MNDIRQSWLVARREVAERARSKGLWVGTAVMLLVVVAMIVVPALMETETVKRDVGFTGTAPEALPAVVAEQGKGVDISVKVHRYDDVAAGEAAVRDEVVDVLVVDARRLEWRSRVDERLRALLSGSIQLVTVQERAEAAGITSAELATVVAPISIENKELGIAAGRSEDDEIAATVMSVLLLMAMATYGQLVLTGVVQEKSSRVVEVLLARMPARNLLAGKVAGIGLIGLTQLVLTALLALVATMVVDGVDIPAVSGDVLTWVVVWFVLGYLMYAMAYGALGSLTSRTEDASSIAAPVTTVLIVGYWGSLIAVTGDPESGWARAVSLFPASAPLAMPARIALGVADWWEPVLAVALTLAATAGLVVLAGRVYTGAILHTGATLKLRDAWARRTASARPTRQERTKTVKGSTNVVLIVVAAAIAIAVYALFNDGILGIGGGAAFYAISSRIVQARQPQHPAH